MLKIKIGDIEFNDNVITTVGSGDDIVINPKSGRTVKLGPVTMPNTLPTNPDQIFTIDELTGVASWITAPTGSSGITSVGISSGNPALQISGSPLNSNGSITVTFNANAVNITDLNGNLTASKIAGGSNGQILTTSGGSVVWADPSSSGVTSVAGKTGVVTLSLDDLTDTIISSPASGQTLRFNGSSFVNAQLLASDLSGLATIATTGSILDAIGVLGVAKGGTGSTSFANNGLLVGQGTSAINTISVPSTSNTFLKWDGSVFVWASPTTVVSQDANPSLGGNLNTNNYTITSGTDSDVVISPNGIGKTVMSGVSYSKVANTTLNNNVSTPTEIFHYIAADYEAIFVDYVLRRGSNTRIGTMMVTNTGSSAIFTDNGTENSDTGINIDAQYISGDIVVQYTSTNTGSPGTITYSVRGWNL